MDVRVEKVCGRFSFMLNTHRIWVNLLQSPFLSGLHGRFIYKPMTLLLHAECTADLRRTAFIHEVIHAIEFLGGIYFKEQEVQALASLFSSFFMESEVGRWVACLRDDLGDGLFRVGGLPHKASIVQSRNMDEPSFGADGVVLLDGELPLDRQRVEMIRQLVKALCRVTRRRFTDVQASTLAVNLLVVFKDNPTVAAWICGKDIMPGLTVEDSR